MRSFWRENKGFASLTDDGNFTTSSILVCVVFKIALL